MGKNILSIALLALANFANAVAVYTLDEQFSQSNQTVLRFKIENNSSETLHGLELRYRVVQKTSNIANPKLYYLSGGTASWIFESSTNATLVISFPNAVLRPGDVLGGNSGFSIGLHNTNWSTWTKSDDPSQPASSSFSLATNVEVFSGGVSLSSNTSPHTECPNVQFVEIWKDSVFLQILQQNNSSDSIVTLKNKNGYSISANLKHAKTDSLGQRIWHGAMPTQDSSEHRGELSVECGGNLIAYFAYGWRPTGASTAVSKKLWDSTNDFVKADFDMGFNQGLAEGQRLALQKDSSGRYIDARHVANWKFYRAWEIPGKNPVPVIWSPALMQYEESDINSLTLEWSPLEGVDWYHLIVLRDTLIGDSLAFVDTAVSLFTKLSSIKIPVLPVGNYVWFVDPLAEVSLDEDEEGAEYLFITVDDATPESGTPTQPRRLSLPSWKKIKRTATEAMGNVAGTVIPEVTIINGIFEGNTKDLAAKYTSPLGLIQIFVHSEILRETVNAVTKNMTCLQETYLPKYIYISPFDQIPSNENMTAFYQCFDSEHFCAMKDTRMLAENWAVGFNKDNWHKIFPKRNIDGKPNEVVKNRCWLTMAQMINHYYGGDLSEDEILYAIRGGFGNTDGGAFPVEDMQAVNYALNLNTLDQEAYVLLVDAIRSGITMLDPSDWTTILPTTHIVTNISVDGWYLGTPSLYTIISTIESGNILGVDQLNAGAEGGHAMVLNGYKIARNGDVSIHLLNTDNMGGSEWRHYGNISFSGTDILYQWITNGFTQIYDRLKDANIKNNEMFRAYYIPPPLAHGRASNASIFEDTDQDGIVDFDENKRFGTIASNPDSDGDGINDYQEIYDYKECETNSGFYMPYVFTSTNPEGQSIDHPTNQPQISYISQSDFDGDGLHAAIDRDSDGDGYCDIQEKAFEENDVTHNCERFDASRHPEGIQPQCWDYVLALLAKERLMLNDMVSCVSLDNTYCPIASYGDDFYWPYGVTLGVGAKAGNIYSTKSVFLRDNAKVFGDLETAGSVIEQSPTTTITGAVVENITHLKDFSNTFYRPVLENVSATVDFSTYQQRIVNSGESVLSNIFGVGSNNEAFNFNSGSALFLNTTGNLFASSLTFQRDAMLHPPTTGSIVFHIGNDFQWNGTVMTNDMISTAQHIMVYYYGTNKVFIQTDFAGTIVAPNAEVVVGQAGKNFYGSIFAKSIVVHQYTKVTWVPFIPVQMNGVVAHIDNHEPSRYSVVF